MKRLLPTALALNNTAIGFNALLFNTADGNTAIGTVALSNNTTGGTLGGKGRPVGPNTAVGIGCAFFQYTTGGANTAVGFDALSHVTSNGFNTAVGFEALFNSTAFQQRRIWVWSALG